MILDGGDCKKGIESTIIGFEENELKIYRLGSISIEEIMAVVGDVKVENKKEIAPNAPGMLSRHYAPKTKMYLVEDVEKFICDFPKKKIGILVFSKEINAKTVEAVEVLSKKGDLKEAASKLYSAMHKLDRLNLDIIVAEVFPDNGLGKSINDRLTRATKTNNDQ
jgi:L-threonylcarbamoyladenylate synthase